MCPCLDIKFKLLAKTQAKLMCVLVLLLLLIFLIELEWLGLTVTKDSNAITTNPLMNLSREICQYYIIPIGRISNL